MVSTQYWNFKDLHGKPLYRPSSTYNTRLDEALLLSIADHAVGNAERGRETKATKMWQSTERQELYSVVPSFTWQNPKPQLLPHRSFTEEHGSIISSFAATFATHPSTTLLRYTIGVLPMSCGDEQERPDKDKRKEATKIS